MDQHIPLSGPIDLDALNDYLLSADLSGRADVTPVPQGLHVSLCPLPARMHLTPEFRGQSAAILEYLAHALTRFDAGDDESSSGCSRVAVLGHRPAYATALCLV